MLRISGPARVSFYVRDLAFEHYMLEAETNALMDSLVRPLLDCESRELNRRITRAAEWAVQAGVLGSGLAFFKRIAAYFDHYTELAGTVWAAMLRVLEETDIRSYPDLPGDLKQKFDGYMSGPAQRTRSSMVALGQMGHAMPKETFDGVYEQTRGKYHTEIELQCRRAAVKKREPQISIGELNMGDNYTAGQAGAMGPQAHAHDMTFHQVSAHQLGQIDMRTLAVELATLRREMRRAGDALEQDIAVGQIAAAEAAAQKGDASSVVRHLKGAGRWAFDVATKIGVSVASEAIKKSTGL